MNQSALMSGANIDTRTEAQRAKDYKFNELVSSPAPVTWTEKPRDTWRRFPIFNQDGSGSCVAQSMAKIMGVLYWLKNQVYVHFSATHIFQRRSNRPQSGMGGVDAFDIARTGVTLEVLTPSQNMTDTQMDAAVVEQYKKDVGTVFKIGNYLTLPERDMETVASVIETTGKAVMVWFFFTTEEWGKEQPTIDVPTLTKDGPTTARHSVTAVDFTLYQGKKALIIDDSWGFWNGFSGQRIITEDFYLARNFFAAYPMNFNFDEATVVVKPKYIFYNDLQFGQTSEEIKKLQDILKFEGLFPTNVESSGYYGAVTQKGVQGFQLKYAVVTEVDAGYGRVGPRTRAKLNELYS